MLTPWMQDGYTALIGAAYHGHLETVQELLKRGADADAKNKVMQGDGGRGRGRGRQ